MLNSLGDVTYAAYDMLRIISFICYASCDMLAYTIKYIFNSCVHYFLINSCVHICHSSDKILDTANQKYIMTNAIGHCINRVKKWLPVTGKISVSGRLPPEIEPKNFTQEKFLLYQKFHQEISEGVPWTSFVLSCSFPLLSMK